MSVERLRIVVRPFSRVECRIDNCGDRLTLVSLEVSGRAFVAWLMIFRVLACEGAKFAFNLDGDTHRLMTRAIEWAIVQDALLSCFAFSGGPRPRLRQAPHGTASSGLTA